MKIYLFFRKPTCIIPKYIASERCEVNPIYLIFLSQSQATETIDI